MKDSYTILQINSILSIKISTKKLELNLKMSIDRASQLVQNINEANWENKRSIQAGTCINSNVFWCYNNDKSISVLIGEDDETWEIGLKLPYEFIIAVKNKLI